MNAIEVSGLGKRYVIEHESRHDNLRDTLHHTARKLWRRFRWGTSFEREEFWALRDVSFSVQPGEVVGIIGRNGAGKSTLLKILSRITEPTHGRIALNGRVASLLEVGTGFHPELSGRENIFLNGAILGMSRAEIRKKFDEIVAFAEVEKFLDTPVKRYSSGMYVRLAFSVAAHLEPEILIVDEVLAVGDAAFQEKCLGKMESIVQGQGRAIIFVSHNVGAIAQLCRRCILLQQGRLVIDAPSSQAINSYLMGDSGSNRGGFDLANAVVVADSPVRLTAVAFNQGEPLLHRRPIQVSIRFHASAPVPAFGLGIGFSGVDGRRIVTVDSDYDSEFLKLEHPGDHESTLQLPSLELIPGRYRVDIGAFGPARQNYHYIGDCGVVEIQPSPETPVHVHNAQGDWRPRGQWSLVAVTHLT